MRWHSNTIPYWVMLEVHSAQQPASQSGRDAQDISVSCGPCSGIHTKLAAVCSLGIFISVPNMAARLMKGLLDYLQ